jgi:predicted transcriptional regulator
MSISTLLTNLSGISPQSRYVLMKLWLDKGDRLPAGMTVQECAQSMAIPKSRAGKILNELTEGGYLELEYLPGEKGRPKRRFNVSMETERQLQALKPAETHEELHLDSIVALLSHRTSNLDADAPILSPSNLVFLITLLGCANECGAVHGLGSTKLMTYTGMTAQRINLQISKLKKLGLLLATVPGVTGRQILGRTTTSYWLDLSHKLLKLPIPSTIIKKTLVTLDSGDAAHALFDIKSKSRVARREHARKSGKQLNGQKALELATVKLHVEQLMDIPNFDLVLVQDFFKEVTNPGLRLAFQTVVDRVARVIAFSRMGAIPREHRKSPTIGQLKTLYQELLPARFLPFRSTDFPLKENRKMLLRVVFRIASSMASDIQANLPTIEGEFSPVVSFELVPVPRGSNYRVLIAVLYPPGSHTSESKQSNIDTSELTAETGTQS